jgi:signal peptidase I
MSSYDKKTPLDEQSTDNDDILEWDFVNDDYGFDKTDDSDEQDDDDYSDEVHSPVKKQKKESVAVTIRSEIFSCIKIFVGAVILAFLFTQFIIVNAEVPTGSMKNTIMEGDRLFGFRLSYIFSEPERGDVVIFKYPDDETQNYVKRIIGIPGDIVQIKEGHVYVNGEQLEEDYISEPMKVTDTEETYVVPEGHYFMMGDNRNYSLDSRYWKNTYVAKDKILAKVIFRYYDGYNNKYSFKLTK